MKTGPGFSVSSFSSSFPPFCFLPSTLTSPSSFLPSTRVSLHKEQSCFTVCSQPLTSPPFSSETDSLSLHRVYRALCQLTSPCPLPPFLPCMPTKLRACPIHCRGTSKKALKRTSSYTSLLAGIKVLLTHELPMFPRVTVHFFECRLICSNIQHSALYVNYS